MRQYERSDIDYESWYSPWMKLLAKSHTRAELEFMLLGTSAEAAAAAGDKAIALRGALEIYELFPEHTAAGVAGGLAVAPSVVENQGVARQDEPAQVLAHGGKASGVSTHPPGGLK